jgi:hypothetical protein
MRMSPHGDVGEGVLRTVAASNCSCHPNQHTGQVGAAVSPTGDISTANTTRIYREASAVSSPEISSSVVCRRKTL